MDSIYNREKEKTEALDEKSIEDMPMSEIEKAKDVTLNNLSEAGREILNYAFKDLEKGGIDRQEYLNILSNLQKLENDLSEDELNEEVPTSFLEYLKDNRDNIGKDLSKSLSSATLQQIGMGTMKFGGLINVLTGTPGPAGSNSFVMVNPNTSKVSNFFIENGKNIRSVGKALGRGFMAAGVTVGMYEDLVNQNKTVGEASAHNGAALAVGIGANAGGTALAAFLLGSNSAGWAVLGGIAVGTAATIAFNFAYENNLLGLQDGLDSVGQKLDEIGSDIKKTAHNVIEGTGEAIQSGLDVINPMNWGW